MNRSLLTCVLFAFGSAALCAQQQTAPPDPYQGQSTPPADDTITTSQPDQPKPAAGKPLAGKPLVSPPADQSLPPAQPAVTVMPPQDNDDGIVQVAPAGARANDPRLTTRAAYEADGDIVHPAPLPPGVLGEGATIRVRLLTLLSTSYSETGQPFRSRVASDVLQDGHVLIPAGSEIDGQVVEVSTGHPGGHGSMRLRPDTVILPDGSRFHLDAQVVGTPGSHTRVSSEGTINAGSRYKKDGVEIGSAVGGGAVTGAVIAGPVGALTGGIIGAGAITVHLLTDHPQATLEPGTVLLFSLVDRLNLVAAAAPGN